MGWSQDVSVGTWEEDGCGGRGRRRRQRKTLLIYIPEFEECSSSPSPLSVRPQLPKERLLVIAVLLKICRAANGSLGRRAVSRDYGALDGIMSVRARRLVGRPFGDVLSLRYALTSFFANAAVLCMVPLPAILQFGDRIHLHKINQRSIQKQLL